MTKKQLRQRIKDVAAGAQVIWVEDDNYWDNMSPENLSNFMEGLTVAFELPRDCYLTHFANLGVYEDLDRLVNLYYESRVINE